MSLSTSLISAAQKLITAFGNDATLYNYSSAITSENNEGEITVLEWLPSEELDHCDASQANWTPTDCTLASDTTTYKEGTGSISWIKTDITKSTIMAHRAITSKDLTGKTVKLYVYIKDAATLAKLKTTGCFHIRLGTGSSDYYDWSKDKSAFSVGWNYIEGLTTSNATTLGTPTITANNWMCVGFLTSGNTDTFAAGDLLMDMIILCSPATTIKVVDGGAEGASLINSNQGLEAIGEDEKIVMNTVTVSNNDRLTYNGSEYKVMQVRSERIESTDIIKIIKVNRYIGTSPW